MAEVRVLEEIRAASGDQRQSAIWYQNQVRKLVVHHIWSRSFNVNMLII